MSRMSRDEVDSGEEDSHDGISYERVGQGLGVQAEECRGFWGDFLIFFVSLEARRKKEQRKDLLWRAIDLWGWMMTKLDFFLVGCGREEEDKSQRFFGGGSLAGSTRPAIGCWPA